MNTILENSMVAGGITPDEYNHDDDRPTEFCGFCGDEVDIDARSTVENGAGIFCNSSCQSAALYHATETASGKAALMRLVAALYLLSAEDVLARAPQLAWDKFDMERVRIAHCPGRYADIANLREQAMALLKTFDIEGGVEWSRTASDMAAGLSECIAKHVVEAK